jgi:threonine/homoserine/homoserine lactone efflux protein
VPLSSFVLAALALNLAPGPDMTYVAARSLAQGRRAGIISALGISCGCVFHIAAAALGVAVLLRAIPQAYAAVRLAGAVYLVYLGIGLIRRARTSSGGVVAVAPAADSAIFRQGVITNVLNPKVALFFLAFLPQFIDPARGPAVAQTLALGLYFNVQGTLVNVAVAVAAASARSVLRGGAAHAWMQRASGTVLIGLGVRLATARGQ